MNQNVTASFSLSLALVVLFSVLLYQPEASPPRPGTPPSPEARPAREPTPRASAARPDPTPGIPLTGEMISEAKPASPAASAPPVTASAGRPRRNAIAASGRRSRPTPEVGPVPRRPPASPRVEVAGLGEIEGEVLSEADRPIAAFSLADSPFTFATSGETLEDISRRVYGTAASTQRIRMANRDLLSASEALPEEGALLRTP